MFLHPLTKLSQGRQRMPAAVAVPGFGLASRDFFFPRFPYLLFHQIPLVDHHNTGSAFLDDFISDFFVLLGDPGFSVEDKDDNVGTPPRMAAETTRRQREELLRRASEGRNRLDVSIPLQDKRYGEDLWTNRRPRSLRKQRSEGRLLFIVLVIALSAAIIWIATHLQF